MLISVIMPIFNGAEYISKSIMSVIGQTYQNIELLLINDGSVDQSEKIIKEIIYENDDRQIRYVKQKNCGIAEARNRGLIEATGDFIFFIDQDDWIEETCIERLVNEVIKSNADEIIGGFKLVDRNGTPEEIWKLDPLSEWSKFRIVAPWGKLFRKALIDKYNIRFLPTKISEDLYFNILFASHTDKVVISSDTGYNWFHNEKSESRVNWNRITEDRNPIAMLNKLQEQIVDSPYLKKDIMTYYFTKYLIWYLLYSTRGSEASSRKRAYRECFEWLQNNYPDFTKWRVTGIHRPKGELLKNRIFVTGCVLLYRLKLFPIALSLYSKF